MRNKKDLLKLIVEMIVGVIALVKSMMFFMSDASDIGIEGIVMFLVVITSMGLINDSVDTFRSELTGTPKKFMFGIFDKELP